MNIFSGMGRLTRDPELKYTQSGIAVANFTIAINRRFKNAQGEYDADFLPCVAWRQTGEFIHKYFKKGQMIGVVGTVQTRSWDGDDGKKRYATEIIVDQAHFTGSKRESDSYQRGDAWEPPATDDDVLPVATGDPESLPFDLD